MRGFRGGGGVRTPLEFAKLNIADFTGNEKISNFSYLCTSTVKRQGCPPPWKNFLDPRLKEEHEMKRKLIRERRMFLSIFHSQHDQSFGHIIIFFFIEYHIDNMYKLYWEIICYWNSNTCFRLSQRKCLHCSNNKI